MRALEVLSRHGGAKLRIDRLVSNLGVTKGSFYWHFEDRKDFVRRLVDYWARQYTYWVPEEVSRVQGDAKARLFALMGLVLRKDLARYDLAIRAWAVQEPEVARVVKKVDEFRLAYVRSLFAEMGFRGRELEMRTRTFVSFHSLEFGLFASETKEERAKLLKPRHALFTRP